MKIGRKEGKSRKAVVCVCVVHTSSFNSLPLFIIMPFYFNILTTRASGKTMLEFNEVERHVMFMFIKISYLYERT
jgi:hypothetical protein